MEATTWRVGQIDARGEDLVLSELRLHDRVGVVDAGATLTSSHSPIAGTLANLIDGNPATTCTFAAADVRSAGFWIQWSLPADEEVRTIRASGATALRRLALMVGGDAFDAIALAGSGYQELVPYPYIEALLSLGPIAAWALDETGGTQTDLVGTNDGVRTGGLTAPTQVFLPDTIAFDPQTTGLVRADAGTFDVGAFSVVFDFRTTDLANKVIIEHGVGNNGWTLQIPPGGSGKLMFLVGGTGAPVYSNTTISDGVPRRVVCTYSPTNGRTIYIDGIYDQQSRLVNNPPSYGNTYLDIGSSAGTYGPAAGSALSNVAIFNRELTPTEIRRLQGAPFTLDTTPVGVDLFLGSETPTGIQVVYLHDATAVGRDTEFSGPGVIVGTVKRENTPTNVPLRRRVRLHREADGLMLRETWSDAVTGAYEFRDLAMQYRYTVITYDYEHNYRAVIADNLQAVLP